MKNRFATIGKLWRTVLACALIVWLAYGLRFSTFNMLAVSITDDLGIARSAFTLSITFRYLTAFFLSLAFGWLVNKIGIMKCLIIGLFTTAVGEYLFSAGSTLPVFYIAGAVSGIGYALASNPIAVLIVNRRFVSHRGLIMGATSAVSGLGQALFNPVVGLLATQWGWRSVYLCSTAIVLVIGLLIVFFLHTDEKYCLSDDCNPEDAAGADKQGMEVGQIIRSVRFWFLMLTGFLIGVAATGSYLIFPSHAQQDGLSLLFVTSVLGITMPLGNIIGKLVFGTLTDRWGAGRAALIPFGANLIGVIAAIFMDPSAAALAVVASLGIGFGISAPNLVPSLWVSELFGQKNSASILGYMMAFVMIGSAVTMPFSNLLFESASSYAPALFVHAVSLAIILIINLSVLSQRSKRLEI